MPLEHRFIIPVRRLVKDNKRFMNVTSYCRAMYGELFTTNCEGIGRLVNCNNLHTFNHSYTASDWLHLFISGALLLCNFGHILISLLLVATAFLGHATFCTQGVFVYHCKYTELI